MDNRGATIMVVDDEDEVREYARSVLESKGFQVLTARNSVEALLLSDHHGGPIRLLITDLSMPPYMDGFELARALQEVRPGLRVLYLSAKPPESLLSGGLGAMDHDPASPAVSHLSKPFTPDMLVKRVGEMLVVPVPRPAPEPRSCRSILMMVPEADVRTSVATLLREEGYLVLEVRNIGEALVLCQWHVGCIGLLLADREALSTLPSELRERLAQIRPEMRILCASVCYGMGSPLGERVKRALEEWGLEAQGGP